MRQLVIFILFLMSMNTYSEPEKTNRIPLFSNEKVRVWKTVIYASKDQVLKMHRHENNRVVVALDSGKLKVTNDKGKVHYLTLEEGQAYYLTKDIPGELHNDENVSGHPIKVIVIELK